MPDVTASEEVPDGRPSECPILSGQSTAFGEPHSLVFFRICRSRSGQDLPSDGPPILSSK